MPNSFVFLTDRQVFGDTEVADMERSARFAAEEERRRKAKASQCIDLDSNENGNATKSNVNCGNDGVDDDVDINIAENNADVSNDATEQRSDFVTGNVD